MRMKTLKAVMAVLFVVWLVAGVGYALTMWQGTITWTVESKQFSVWNSLVAGSPITSPYTPNSTVLTIGVHNYTFYLQNDGNVEVTITATSVEAINCTASWSNMGIYTVPKGTTRVAAILTLNVSGAGSYDWNFQVS